DAFLNITGAQEIRDEHMVCPRRVYVESDPFASQVRVAAGDASTIAALEAHDTHFTFGENLGTPDCDVPLECFRWLPTRQPVLLDLWAGPDAPPPPSPPLRGEGKYDRRSPSAPPLRFGEGARGRGQDEQGRPAYTTITTWHNKGKNVTYRGDI